VDVAAAARAKGVKNVAVTAGYISDGAREEFFRDMDAANVDVKAFTDGFYKKLCSARLAPVLETLEYLKRETNVWLEITTLLIPGQNDSDREVAAISEWIAGHLGPDVPLHFSAFHPDWKMRDIPATPVATLKRAREIARKAGLRHVYTGNIHDPAGQSTFCPNCGICLIGRDGYRITGWSLDEHGRCSACATPLPGVFEPEPGKWGSRRAAVRVLEAGAHAVP
jgi:pyruvate formate lyase activating enzyme